MFVRHPAPIVFLLLLTFAGVATAQESKASKKIVITDPNKVDADFYFQGEYLSWFDSENAGCDDLALQVIALGERKFDAVLYQGGLPGSGWDRLGKTALSGERSGDVLMLKGAGRLIRIHRGHAALRSGGHQRGVLRKVRRTSMTMGAVAPRGATVLFDGSTLEHFEGGEITPEGFLKAGVLTKAAVRDFCLHLEFRTPYMPNARGQARGNSGVYIQQRYEVQVLDSFGLEGVANECSGLYKQQAPEVNMCLPPLSWQTYDIYFTAALWNTQGEKTANARITVLLNGVTVHRDYEITAKTGGGQKESPETRPIMLQDHHDPVVYRNVWIDLPN